VSEARQKPIGEFELIRLLSRVLPQRGTGVVIGIGDDAAVLRPPAGEPVVATVDAVVEGVHFTAQTPPEHVGWKALAVNLSDLAAMGARPLWALWALATPRTASKRRLAGLAAGLAACARRYRVALVGGNVTAARELSLTVTVLGSAPCGRVVTRSGAKVGDAILVSGTLGDAALGLEPGAPPACRTRQQRPIPRLELGRVLSPIATSSIDLSDGLLQDLGHVCQASRVGASVGLSELPLSAAYDRATRSRKDRFDLALAGGEDYELCVTVPIERLPEAFRAARQARTPLSIVGAVVKGKSVQVVRPDGGRYEPCRAGYDHMARSRPKPIG
jgi:thiamine-monophosphate kinase